MNKQRLIAMTAAAGLAVVSHGAAAKGFNYTYGEFGYRNFNSDLFDGDGFQADFSFGATDYVNVIGAYSHLWIDNREGASHVNLDLDEFKIGFGGHYPVHEKVDIGATVSYVDEQFTGKDIPHGATNKTNVNSSDEGYEAVLYGRIQAMKKLELTPHVVHLDVGSYSATGFGTDLIYNFYKHFSARISGTHFSDDSTTNVFAGVRLDF